MKQNRLKKTFSETPGDFWQDYILLKSSGLLERLRNKTLLWSFPVNGEKSRYDHCVGVGSLATEVAIRLGLNLQLCGNIGLFHDLGQPSFGHQGERVLSKISGREFHHEIFGPIIVLEILELNLSHQAIEGIMWHDKYSAQFPYFTARGTTGITQEAELVKHCDKHRFIVDDLEDCTGKAPIDARDFQWLWFLANELGKDTQERFRRIGNALVQESLKEGCVSFQYSEIACLFWELKKLMRSCIYMTEESNQPDFVERTFREALQNLRQLKELTDIDSFALLALMDNHEILAMANAKKPKIFWRMGVSRFVPFLKGKRIDFSGRSLLSDLKHKAGSFLFVKFAATALRAPSSRTREPTVSHIRPIGTHEFELQN